MRLSTGEMNSFSIRIRSHAIKVHYEQVSHYNFSLHALGFSRSLISWLEQA